MSTISASTASNTAFKVTSDTTGTLVFQTGAVPTTAISIDASQVVSIGNIAVTGATTFAAGSAAAPSITTTGDTNTGIFFPAADTIAFTEGGVEAARFDSSGNFNIGTTTVPGSNGGGIAIFKSDYPRLTFRNTTTGDSATDGTQFAAVNANFEIYNKENGNIEFGTNNTERLRLDSFGFLGLGVTPSAWDTSASRVLQLPGGSVWSFSTSQLNLVQNSYYDGSNFRYTNTAAASAYRQISGVHSWYNAASGTAGNTVTFTQAMTLDASGNLLVNDTAVTTLGGSIVQLQIKGKSAGRGGGIRLLSSDSSLDGFMYVADGLISYGSGTSTPLSFVTGNTERFRITAAGDFLVGKTTANAGIVGFEARASGFVACAMTASTNTSDTLNVYSTGAAAYRFYVDMGGTIHATSVVITAISDQRLKENVRDIDTGLDSIMALKPRRFDWKEGKGQDKKNAVGFIAQEFEQVFPECVGVSKAGADGIEYKNINHETLIPTLVKAIQELTARLAALESK